MKFEGNTKLIAFALLVLVCVLAALAVVLRLVSDGQDDLDTMSEPVSMDLPAGEAVVVTHESGARIEVPAGATSEPTTVSVAEVVPPESDIEVRRVFDFSVGGVELLTPVTIYIPFELNEGEDSSAVHALHWSDRGDGWEPVAGEVSESDRTIAITTSDLSLFSWLWIYLNPGCQASADAVEGGHDLTIAASGTNPTEGRVSVFMRPVILNAADGSEVFAGEPELTTDAVSVDSGERFQLTFVRDLVPPGEYRIRCRFFWESAGSSVELAEQEPSPALVTVPITTRLGYDLRLQRVEKVDARPLYVGENFQLSATIVNGGEGLSESFNLVTYLHSIATGEQTRIDYPGMTTEVLVRGHHSALDRNQSDLFGFYGDVPDTVSPGEHRLCLHIESASRANDADQSNNSKCLYTFVLPASEGSMDVFATYIETDDGHRVWLAAPDNLMGPEHFLNLLDIIELHDDDTIVELYKSLALEMAFRKALQSDRDSPHVFFQGLMEGARTGDEVRDRVTSICERPEVGCAGALKNTGLLDSGLFDDLPADYDEVVDLAGQSLDGVLLFGDVYYTMLVNQAIDFEQAFHALNELSLLPLGPLWDEGISAAQYDISLMDSSRWNALALEIVNNKGEFINFALKPVAGGLTKWAVKKQLLQHFLVYAHKGLAHAFGLKVTGVAVTGTAAAGSAALLAASLVFAYNVYSDVEASHKALGVALLASFVHTAFAGNDYRPEMREALAYAEYVAYDKYHESDASELQWLAAALKWNLSGHRQFLEQTAASRDSILEELKSFVTLQEVVIRPAELTLGEKESRKLEAAPTTGSGRVLSSADVVWSTNARRVATVTQAGVVTGVKPGVATISAKLGRINRTAKVTVGNGTAIAHIEGEPFSRNPSQEFPLTGNSGRPTGIWSNGATMWVADWYDRKIYAYDLGSGSRDPDRDIDGLVDAGNDAPGNIWSDGATMWVVDSQDLKIYAYSLSSGQRVPSEDFNGLLASGNDLPNGIWSDGETMWVGNVIGGAGGWKIFAYDISSKTRIPESDFPSELFTAGRHPIHIAGLWSDGTTMWVVNSWQGFTSSSLVAFDLATKQRKPTQDFGIFTSHLGQITDIWSDGSSTMWVAISHSTDSWISAYNIDSMERDPAKDLDSLVGQPLPAASNVWSDGSTMWVSAGRSRGERYRSLERVHAFSVSTKERNSTRSIDTLEQDGLHFPSGIWSDGETMWLADSQSHDRIFAYNLVSRGRDPQRDIAIQGPLDDGIVWWGGMWSDGTTVWLLDSQGENRKIYAFNFESGLREREKDFDTLMEAGNRQSAGIWSDGITMWVTDSRPAKIFAYDMSTKQRDPSKDIDNLSQVGNRAPRGIWSDGQIMWVIDGEGHRMYAYDMPPTGGTGTFLGDARTDRQALVVLYRRTGGTDGTWRISANWLTDAPLSEWYGVTTDSFGRVTALNLLANNLSGEIPPAVGDLRLMVTLKLEENRISGELPNALGNLVSLQELDLSDNQLDGEIPSSIGNLSSLLSLNLSQNRLEGDIPSSIGDLAALHVLNFSRNQLAGRIPVSVVNLANLESLLLDRNTLVGEIPSELGDMAQLRTLKLSRNRLTGAIPLSLGNIVDLHALALGSNQLTGEIPASFGDFRRLWHLDLSNNRLTGEIPASFANLTQLRSITLAGNQFTGCIPAGLHGKGFNDLGQLGLPYCTAETTPSPDRAALVALYNATDGDNWTSNSNWISDSPIWDWHGIAADRAGRVTQVELSRNGLRGTIPSELSDLTHVNYLSLGGNQLTGRIPQGLGDLLRLRTLLIDNNQLTGEIPASLGDATSLSVLRLSANQLSGSIPPQLGNLINLQHLQLGDNRLTGSIPPEFGELGNLRVLDLQRNALDGSIPGELGKLQNLTQLSLGQNQFSSGIPTELASLANLEHLNLYGNRLSGTISPEFGSLTRLTSLSLNQNNLSGAIPPELERLTRLNGLWLSENQFTECIPDRLHGVPNNDLLLLELPKCSEEVVEPDEADETPTATVDGDASSDRAALVALYEATAGENWANSTGWVTDAPLGEWHGVETSAEGRVTRLMLDRNGLTGFLPPELGNLTELERLLLGTNKLSGVIPSEIGSLSNLIHLSLGYNQLSGPIPSTLRSLTNLKSLGLGQNQLTGTFPAWLGELSEMAQIFLFSNQLSGEITPQLGSLTKLRTLNIYGNLLSGSIPSTLGDLSELWYLNLSDNMLSGAIPSQLGNLSKLNGIYLSRNEFTGCIPSSLHSVPESDLEDMQLPYCTPVELVSPRGSAQFAALEALYNATGGDNWVNNTGWLSDVPIDEWFGIEALSTGEITRIALSNNNLSGPLPPELGSMSTLRHLFLDRNDLTGSIPPELGNLANLIQLDLTNNSLSGQIPRELSFLGTLAWLSLTQNQLSGEIPPELGQLTGLRSLFLDANQLIGTIPSELAGLDALWQLGLGGNQLTGEMPEWLSSFTDLQNLGLEGNRLEGELPAYLGDFTLLRYLSLGGNQFTGSIPVSIGKLSNLENLQLSGNQLTGEIPAEVGNLTNLVALRISSNQLSGAIPSELTLLTELRFLAVSRNQFTGCIPAGLQEVMHNDLDRLDLPFCS